MKAEVAVSVVQIAPTWCQNQENIQKMVRWAEQEAKEGAELIVFPELIVQGYVTPVMPGDPVDFPSMSFKDCAMAYHRAAETIPGPATKAMEAVAKKYGVYIVFGMAQRHPEVQGLIYNAAVLAGPDGVIGVHHKMHLPLMEKHYFYPGDCAQVFDTPLGKIGMGVCCDARTPEYTKLLSLKGAEIVCNIWAIASENTKESAVSPPLDTIKCRAFTRAQENGVYHLNSSLVGMQGNYHYIGHSCIAAPIGEILAASSSSNEEAVRATITDDALLYARSVYPIYRDRRPELYGLICQPMTKPWEFQPPVKAEEIVQGEVN